MPKMEGGRTGDLSDYKGVSPGTGKAPTVYDKSEQIISGFFDLIKLY